MFLIVMLCLFSAGEAKGVHWRTENTGVFRPLVCREVVVNAKGEVFLVNRNEATVLKYGPDGKRLKSFAGKGDGPGELLVPTWLHLQGDQLFVEDARTQSVSVFDANGKFIKRIKTPENDLVLVKVNGGWIYGDWETSKDTARPVQIFFSDEKFTSRKVLTSWKRPKENANTVVTPSSGRKPVVPVNPAVDSAYITGSADGKQVYFTKHGSDDLQVIDVAQKKVIRTIKNENQALPFNKEWGNSYIEKFREGLPEKTRSMVDVKAVFPPYFPLVKDLRRFPNGMLIMELWTGMPDTREKFMLFDASFQKVEAPWLGNQTSRVVGIRDNLVYLITFDPDKEEGGIACVEKQNVKAFLEANSIDYDGMTGNDVVVD